eukprot:m.251337 g.251337  ORF g.251337 m.251337 type:complete len:737 (-) comp33894_c0_seq1:176-2386(-)
MAEVEKKQRLSSFEPPGVVQVAEPTYEPLLADTNTGAVTEFRSYVADPERYFRKEAFRETKFSVDNFLKECRSRVSMPDLQLALAEYHSSLSNAMFALINKDYGDFLSLSANLAGLDKSISELTTPLQELKKEVKGLKTSMDSEIRELDERLRRRVDISAQRTLLQRFLNISASVDKIEKLLSTAQPPQSKTSGEGGDSTSATRDIESLMSGSGELIERVASEFNQLQFYVTQCQRGAPFLTEISPRIKRITTTLQDALERTFRKGIEADDIDILRQCLRTYSIIDKIDEVQILFRDLVVAPFATTAITKEVTSSLSLEDMYKNILSFIHERCRIPMQIVSQLNISGCDFLVNSVWPEIAEALSKLTFIFAHGIADEFHKNYTTTEAFISDFEKLCGTRMGVERLRAHPAYLAFRKRWSIQVYYQLRFQEIAGEFETKLSEPLVEQMKSESQDDFKLGASTLLFETITRCWSPSVYIPGLCHRFWKLTLQLLARYTTWVSSQAGGAEPISNILVLIQDSTNIQTKTLALLDTVIKPELVTVIASGLEVSALKKALDDSCEQLQNASNEVQKGALSILTSACETHVRGSMGVNKRYRHTKKPTPETPSEYIEKILLPIKTFVGEYGTRIGNCKRDWVVPVCRSTTKRFEENVTKLLADEAKMEERLSSLKKIKRGKRNVKENNSESMSDHDKIRLQLWLDVTAFTTELEFIDVSRDDVPELIQLRKLVDDAKPALDE